MAELRTYTQEEVDKALSSLKDTEESLIRQRSEINKALKELKDNIKFYEELDLKQHKLL